MTQQYIGRKIITGWRADKTGRVRVCGVDCHKNDQHCNGYCQEPKVASPPPAPDLPGYGVKYADGYTSWSPAEAFEAAYLALGHVDHLPEWHQLLIGEHALLDADIKALDRFMDTQDFVDLTQEHGYLLQLQFEAMVRYRDLLEQRLDLLGTPRTRATALNPPAVATGD